MFQIHAAHSKMRKREKKEDHSSRNLQVTSSSPLPVGAPAGQGQQTVAMVMGGGTGPASPPAGIIHLQETEAPDDGAHLSPSDVATHPPTRALHPEQGQGLTSHPRKSLSSELTFSSC